VLYKTKPTQGVKHMIREIIFHEYQVKPLNFTEWSEFTKTIIQQQLTSAELRYLDIYNMNGKDSGIKTGDKDRLVILANHPQHIEGELIFNDNNGNLLATYIEVENNTQQINIHTDLFQEWNEQNKETFAQLIRELNERVYLQKQRDFSWKLTSKKAELTQSFSNAIKQSQEKYIREDESMVREYESKIREYTKKLKEFYDQRTRRLNQIETATSKLEAVEGKLIQDLDNIVNHPKITDLYIKNGLFVVHTAPIYAYHDKTGERYYIGNFRIEMNPNNTEVRFFGDNPRKSYWSKQDPHPHVSGKDGHACLGNVATTIAELCSQMELYALTLIAIDFLESVNTSDPAGKNIINWDKVDEEGNIVLKGGQPTWSCDYCGSIQPITTTRTRVYTHIIDEDEVDDETEQYVCPSCVDSHFTYSDEHEEYVLTDALEEE
jgi:hypothetical protein